MRGAVAVVGLACLLVLHFTVRTRINYDFSWVLHIAGGILLAMFFQWWLPSWPLFRFAAVGLMAISWEVFEIFCYGGPIFCWDRCGDILWALAGAAVYSWIVSRSL